MLACDGSHVYKVSLFALDILVNIAGNIDIYGNKRTSANDTYLHDSFDTQNRNLLKLDISSHMTVSNSQHFGQAVAKLFPCVFRCIASNERELVVRGLRLLTKLASNNDNSSIFALCPQHEWEILVSILYVNMTTADCMQLTTPQLLLGDSATPLILVEMNHSKRIPACTGGFFDLFDLEIRDLALDALQAICSLPVPSIKYLIGQTPKCLKVLAKIGCDKSASKDSVPKALSILQLLAQNSANHSKFLALQRELITVSFSDDAIAGSFSE